MGSPEFWRWAWLATSAVFAVGEMSVAGSFFLAPFAIGAAVAAVLSFAGLSVTFGWIAFLVVSGVSLAALRPLARRLDREGPVLGIGSHRQVGQVARVIDPIDSQAHTGTVMLGAERWRAESIDGRTIAAGSAVAVVEVRGTRLLVRADPTTHALPDVTEPENHS